MAGVARGAPEKGAILAGRRQIPRGWGGSPQLRAARQLGGERSRKKLRASLRESFACQVVITQPFQQTIAAPGQFMIAAVGRPVPFVDTPT
jgi:hypothetical protein